VSTGRQWGYTAALLVSTGVLLLAITLAGNHPVLVVAVSVLIVVEMIAGWVDR